MLATRYQDYMFSLLKKVIDEIGPRPPCSEAEKKLGRLLVEEWKPICDRVDVETFKCSPHAFIGSVPVIALFCLGAVVLYWFLSPLALALAAVSCSILVVEVLQYREFVDFLFPRRQGENVIGTIRPKGDTAQRVIVSAHMDSAYESTVFFYLKSASIAAIVVGIAGPIIALGACLARTIAYFDVFSSDAALSGVGIAMIALSPFMGAFLFFTLWKPVPGAWDNMSGVSIVAGLGRYLGEARVSGEWFPQRTEVILLATSSEEAGLRGAKRYVKEHLRDMQAMRTHCLNMDSLKDENFMCVVKGESSTGARHDPQLVGLAREAAASHNWRIAVAQMPPPFGTDAAAFSLNGIPATTFTAGHPSGWDPTYHTRRDTYDHVRPESLSATLQIVIDMIQRIDKGELAGSA